MWPYAARVRVGTGYDPWCLDLLVPLVLVFAFSIWGAFAEQTRISRRLADTLQPMRGKPRASTRVQDGSASREVA